MKRRPSFVKSMQHQNPNGHFCQTGGYKIGVGSVLHSLKVNKQLPYIIQEPQIVGGLPHPKGMVPEPVPEWLNTYCKRIGQLGVFNGQIPNHVLVNEYLPGQGIMPHTDGPLYFPTVSTITLGSHTFLDFYSPLSSDSTSSESTSFEDRHFASLLLERRSLVLVRDEMYTDMLHGIKEVNEDRVTDIVKNLSETSYQIDDVIKRETRISLTIRVVPKVLKTKLFFGNRR